MRIEAVTVCVDYADFLAVTLPYIRNAVDDLVVVTSPSDRRTRKLCRDFANVRTVVTTAMYDHDRRFSLGAAIAAGLRACELDDWVLVVDADIILPGNARGRIERSIDSHVDIYGVDRVHCRGWHAWRRFASTPRVVMTWEVPFLRDFPMGARITPDEFGGYMPCGFFQLWNPGWSGVPDYPIHPNGTAEGSDVMHASRWERGARVLIPDLVAIQLETDTATDPVGVNWSGRRTAEFSAEGGPYRR